MLTGSEAAMHQLRRPTAVVLLVIAVLGLPGCNGSALVADTTPAPTGGVNWAASVQVARSPDGFTDIDNVFLPTDALAFHVIAVANNLGFDASGTTPSYAVYIDIIGQAQSTNPVLTGTMPALSGSAAL